ncbi:MAG: hypothetical protein IPM71_15510 [Bacteroidota bacterium]|nr:MAG: hypothetical protein IPM71_15510 [Bacteroidota bacterium]
MILFNDKYNLELNISHRVFIDGLLKMTELREDLSNDIFPNKKKDFLGQIEYNRFTIVKNKSFFLQNNYKIVGQIIEQGDKIHINGSIKGYKLLLLYVLTFSLFSFSGMIVQLFFIDGQEDLRNFFSILTLVGSTNTYIVVNGFNKYKKQFIEKIKSIN